MSAREGIISRIRNSLPSGDFGLPPVPHFVIQGGEQGRRLETFTHALEAMGGRLFRASETASPLAWIRKNFPGAKTICSATTEVPGNRAWSTVYKPQDLADVDVGVARAVLGVAESGSVLFTEAELKVNTLAYLSQHLVVLLHESAIVSGLQEAYTHAVFREARYAVFHTGPSATGDIEGVLIHGAQGVRSLTVIVDGGQCQTGP
jgi:L-lactate dehydrogenase complex protein LldG